MLAFQRRQRRQAAINATNASFGCARVAQAWIAQSRPALPCLTMPTTAYLRCRTLVRLVSRHWVSHALSVDSTRPGDGNLPAAHRTFRLQRSANEAGQNVTTPIPGFKALNFQISYSLSRFENSGAPRLTGTAADNDQDFVLPSADNNKPNRYFGPSLLDRTHQISFGGYADLPGGFRMGLTTHFGSPHSSGWSFQTRSWSGEIFRTDFTGDGTSQDPMPGTHFGEFDRGMNASQHQPADQQLQHERRGQATPAGEDAH